MTPEENLARLDRLAAMNRHDYLPGFLRYGDPLPNLHGEHQRHPYKDFPLLVDEGYGEAPWTVEDMLAWVEREWDRQAAL